MTKTIVACLLVGLFLGQPVEGHTYTHSKVLKVLSYNIQGLPWPFALTAKRFKDIGKVLEQRKKDGTAPDLVLLQESFIPKTKDLRKYADYPYVAKGPGLCARMNTGRIACALGNSGIYILSLHPIVKQARTGFSKKHCGTADCWANKGVQMALIAPEGLPFQIPIFNTHMQANDPYEADRIAQNSIIKTFLDEKNPEDLPFIFAGDFNFRPNLQSFHDFVQKTGLLDVGQFCLNPGQTECKIEEHSVPGEVFGGTVDHHFIRNVEGAEYSIQPIYVEKNFKEPINGRMPSDHEGYEVHYEIRW